MSSVTVRTDCMVSQHLWDVVVNCSLPGTGSCKSSVTKGAVDPGNNACPALMHVRLSVEHSRHSMLVSDDYAPQRANFYTNKTRWQSSAKYDAEFPDSDQWTSVATLWQCWHTGIQCSRQSTGAMCSQRRVPVTRRLEAFWKCIA